MLIQPQLICLILIFVIYIVFTKFWGSIICILGSIIFEKVDENGYGRKLQTQKLIQCINSQCNTDDLL